MFKRTTLVLTGLAWCLTLPALAGGRDADNPEVYGCLPPPVTKDYVKKTVRVEIKGKLQRVRLPIHLEDAFAKAPPRLPIDPPDDTIWPRPHWYYVWQVSADDKTYQLDFGERKDFADLVNKLNGTTVIVAGTLEEGVVHMTSLKADESDFVKQTVEVEVRGRLAAVRLGIIDIGFPHEPGDLGPVVAWNLTVDGKTYALALSGTDLEQLAQMYDGQAVVITGTLDKDTITVKTLKAAP
jgi:hypothetical protein